MMTEKQTPRRCTCLWDKAPVDGRDQPREVDPACPFHSEQERCPTCGGNPRVPNLVAANAYCPDPSHSEPAPVSEKRWTVWRTVAGGPWQLGPVPSHHSLNEIERVEVVPEQQLDELRNRLADQSYELGGEKERAEQYLAEAVEALERIAGPQTMNSFWQELRACKADARDTLARLKGEAS